MARSRPLPGDWHSRRAAALRRDKGRCRKCGRPGNEVDHVKAAWAGGSDEQDNLQTLCRRHHALKTARDAREYRAWQAERNRRRDPTPGMAR